MNSWSALEVKLIIANYFEMLSNEMLGKAYAKAAFRLFNFESDARLFKKNGGLDTICQSIPMTFKGFF